MGRREAIKQRGKIDSVDLEETDNFYTQKQWVAVFCKLYAKIVRMVKERTLKKDIME
jgi:hypothetical protein